MLQPATPSCPPQAAAAGRSGDDGAAGTGEASSKCEPDQRNGKLGLSRFVQQSRLWAGLLLCVLLCVFGQNSASHGTFHGKHKEFKAVLRILRYDVAEEVGFEPTVGFHPRRFSRPVR